MHEIDYLAVTVSLTEKDRVLDFEDPPYSLAIVQCCSLELDACLLRLSHADLKKGALVPGAPCLAFP